MKGSDNKENPLKSKLAKIAEQIEISWIKNCDKTVYMRELIKMLGEIQEKESLEEYFSNDVQTLNYFMNDFYNDVIQYILIQPFIYGNEGDEIGLELFLNSFKLFLKFHKHQKYANLFLKLRKIFHRSLNRFFFEHDYKYNSHIKIYDVYKFNEVYNKKFAKPSKSNNFKVGDEVDFPLDIATSISIEKKMLDERKNKRNKKG